MSLRILARRRALLRPATTLAAIAVTATTLLGTVAPAHATDRAATAMTVTPAKVGKYVNYGVTFTWTLKSGSTRLAGRPVTVYTRPTSSRTWTKVSTRNLNSYGTTSYSMVVKRSTWVIARFFGDTKYAPAKALGTVYALTLADRAVIEASHHQGAPYQWGAVGPDRFDCSGFTRYVWGRLGRSLPHNSGQQYGVVQHVAKSSIRVGDLVFMYSSSGIYHVAIYAGNGYIWHAPHSGDVVKRSPIWTSSYYVGRVA